jgi:hypothetical protein
MARRRSPQARQRAYPAERRRRFQVAGHEEAAASLGGELVTREAAVPRRPHGHQRLANADPPCRFGLDSERIGGGGSHRRVGRAPLVPVQAPDTVAYAWAKQASRPPRPSLLSLVRCATERGLCSDARFAVAASASTACVGAPELDDVRARRTTVKVLARAGRRRCASCQSSGCGACPSAGRSRSSSSAQHSMPRKS